MFNAGVLGVRRASAVVDMSLVIFSADQLQWVGLTRFGLPAYRFLTHSCPGCGCQMNQRVRCADCDRELGCGD